jgi:hypothetical protein
MDRKRLGRGQQDEASIESRKPSGVTCALRASRQGQVIDRRTAVRVEGRADVRAETVPYGNKEES